jgi:hypothetical protein
MVTDLLRITGLRLITAQHLLTDMSIVSIMTVRMSTENVIAVKL